MPRGPPEGYVGADLSAATPSQPSFTIRVATRDDVPALRELIPVSVRALSAGFYSAAEIESALLHVFGVDTQLIDDGTYFVAERAGEILGCGGWSRRRTLYGGDQAKTHADTLLDPNVAPARIRAFYVHPESARQGIGRALLAACTSAARLAGFRRLELVATLPGEPLYRALGFEAHESFGISLPEGISLASVRMSRPIEPGITVQDVGSGAEPGTVAALREWLRNVYPLYLHDLTEFDTSIYSLDRTGRFQPDHLPYWLGEAACHPLVALHEGRPFGFAFVGEPPFPFLRKGVDHELSEFFVLRGDRRSGLSRVFAREILRARPGRWELQVLERNAPAAAFWRAVLPTVAAGRAVLETAETKALRFAFEIAAVDA